MSVSLLNLEKVHPPIHTPRFSARFRTQAVNAPAASAFKNPFFGLELNYLKQISDIESIHKPTSSRKKKVLLNVLEDIANIDYGFKNQVLYALNILKPPEKENDDLFEMTSARDIVNLRKEISEANENKKEAEDRVNKLKKRLERKEKKNQEMLDEIERMKGQLKDQNDRFAYFRKIKSEMKSLQAEYDKIFVPEDEGDDERLKKLLQENNELRKNILKLRYELDIATQVTSRLQFREELDF
ncbi:hypothetical protein TRFO_03327 [Tritrichomonas foetus]|uniref:Uncharacterized protein n=1 Tax=Tritrichomonas foetus TaxID=1144522 RepID=A0A1J4KQP1_9EUKA|nr:hypothetical protein TRFO_03327 [Tritrichomonas foetus]|eukprot:OHT13571.1 hypothetical protein TRFO_03327 [Tritrichomonas foetus]